MELSITDIERLHEIASDIAFRKKAEFSDSRRAQMDMNIAVINSAIETLNGNKQECDRLVQEVAGMADELAFWKFQAMWHRAKLTNRDLEHTKTWHEIDAEFEKFRQDENRERYFPEAPRDIGS